MKLTLVRHATLLVDVGDVRLLVDPMLAPPETYPPVENTPNQRRNPATALPRPVAEVLAGVDGVLVTHLHNDHFDEAAARDLPRDLPLLCQPEDQDHLKGHGFTDVRPVENEIEWRGLRIARTGGRHGTGAMADLLAPVSGFAVSAAGEPTLLVAGDTIWCKEVADALATHRPALVVVNAGAAQFLQGGPITMTADDVLHVARAAPEATVVAVHLDVINHCLLSRAELRQVVTGEGLDGRVLVPDDDEVVSVQPPRVVRPG